MDKSQIYDAAHLERSALSGDREQAVQTLLKQAFPDIGEDYYSADRPDRIVLLSNEGRPIGHLAAYVRTVSIADEELAIGLVGGVAVDAQHRRQGHAKRLLREAHGFFTGLAALLRALRLRPRALSIVRLSSDDERDAIPGQRRPMEAIGLSWRNVRRAGFAEMAQQDVGPARPSALTGR
jgi:GNAT superfamily N-acetyltransferase